MFKDDIRPASYWTICSALILVHLAFFLKKNGIWFTSSDKVFNFGYQVVIPFGVLLMLCAVPKGIRDSIAHFKIRNPLPGSEAFSRWSKEDERISLDGLKAKFGKLPTKKSKQQNAKWYAIYQSVKRQPEIIAAQRKYILFRDLALIQACAATSWVFLASIFHPLFEYEWIILIATYGLFVMTVKNTSIRFVQTVMAVASH